MNYAVIIPTRDRIDILRKTLPLWLEHNLPMLLLTEPSQVQTHRALLKELGIGREILVSGHRRSNKGIGYARKRAVEIAGNFNVDAFIMADDDMKITKGDPRKLLDFVAAGKAIICGGWMSNYGLWVPNGNELKNHDNLVIPCGGARDRVLAINTQLCLAAGNFHPGLRWLDTQEMNRRGLRAGHLWYIHTGCHIAMVNKPRDPGGIQALYQTEEERAAQGRKDHELTFKLWGPRYISAPPKRMSTRWLRMAEDFIGPKAAEAIKESRSYPEDRVAPALRMFGRSKST